MTDSHHQPGIQRGIHFLAGNTSVISVLYPGKAFLKF
jgi:hypothetical protein